MYFLCIPWIPSCKWSNTKICGKLFSSKALCLSLVSILAVLYESWWLEIEVKDHQHAPWWLHPNTLAEFFNDHGNCFMLGSFLGSTTFHVLSPRLQRKPSLARVPSMRPRAWWGCAQGVGLGHRGAGHLVAPRAFRDPHSQGWCASRQRERDCWCELLNEASKSRGGELELFSHRRMAGWI
jgi:hypothetical protein